MSDQFWLSEKQLARIKPCFPLSHGMPRVDDRKVISGIIQVSEMDCAGGAHPRSMGRTKPCTTGLSGGRRWVCLTRFSQLWSPKMAHQAA